jgi:hypothetical protein
MSLTIETIAINRYAPKGSEGIHLYSNGLDGGSHLTLGQLSIAVSMRAAAEYEAQSVLKMNRMASGSQLLSKASEYMAAIADDDVEDWSAMKTAIKSELGIPDESLPDNLSTYKKRMTAVAALKAKIDSLTQTQQTDMIDMQTLVNRRDVAFSASSNIVRTLGTSMNSNAENF